MKKIKVISIILILFSIYSFNERMPKSFSKNSLIENNSLPNDFYFIMIATIRKTALSLENI
ncbi:hypothetical protein BC952_1349 [Flavobacterium limicola]|uniref:Uncharacterized protein n=1 Tax=Flavobacterium limicola TaxID=180441 RepID=A0A495S758_9FLAO|nr:hypothetical protein BC952_1349 [Flavobacterium limicola]